MKRIFVFLLVLVIVSISQAVPVTFNDPNLKAAVEAKLGITDPNSDEMLLLTSLDANSLGISDLTGLDYATNLTTLYLCNNNLNDLIRLSGLTKMKYLRLGKNPNLANLAPLADMNNLLSFWAYDCDIADINVVSKFTKLQSLHLGLNLISDVNALSGLSNLKYLNLHHNDITDINKLENLTKLVYLFLSYNDNIPDINALSGMNNLVELGLADVNVIDISPLADVNQIRYLWLAYNQITDINALTKDVNFITLSLSYNPLSFDSWCVYLRQIKDKNPTANIYTVPAASGLLNTDSTDFIDLRIFASQWLKAGCNTNNAFCKCADLTESGQVNFDDYVDFADVWMFQL